MRLPSKTIRIAFAIVALLVLVAYGMLRITSSPTSILKHTLNISKIPGSVGNLRMGSDVWTDEVRCFYFTIAPGDFQHLLTGRHFEEFVSYFPFEASTIHVSPPATIRAATTYSWQTDSANCKIWSDDSREHVIVIFSAD